MFKYKIAKTLPTKVLLSIPYTGLHALNNFLNGDMGYVAMCGVISVLQLFCFKKLKKLVDKMEPKHMNQEERVNHMAM